MLLFIILFNISFVKYHTSWMVLFFSKRFTEYRRNADYSFYETWKQLIWMEESWFWNIVWYHNNAKQHLIAYRMLMLHIYRIIREGNAHENAEQFTNNTGTNKMSDDLCLIDPLCAYFLFTEYEGGLSLSFPLIVVNAPQRVKDAYRFLFVFWATH